MPTQSKPVQQLTPFGAALAGALGGCFSTALVYPLDVAKTRIQALPRGKDRHSMMTLLLRIYKKEGIMGWYQGFTATMINTFSMQYAYFFFYSLVRSSYIKRITRRLPAGSKPPTLSTLAELVLGAVAGALAQVFTIPVSVIATRQQLGRAEELGDTDNSFMSVAREIIEEDGVTGLWLGLNPGLVLTVNPAITYGLFERIKSMVLQTKGMSSTKMGPWLSFVVGALSKTLATVVTYPYIMAKVRIQARTTDSEETEKRSDTHQNHHKGRKHPGALKVLIAVWKHEGFFGWYQGMQAQITKAVLSQALLFMSKEQFEHWALAIMTSFAMLVASKRRRIVKGRN